MATIAVFIALGGTAMAGAALIDGEDLKNGSVAGKKLKRHTVTAKQIKLASLPYQRLCRQGAILGFAVVLGKSVSFADS
jgi:hypothetical protein